MVEFEKIEQVVDSGDLEQLKALIAHCPELLNSVIPTAWGNPSLMLMYIGRNNDEGLCYLLEQGADPNQQPANVIGSWLDRKSHERPSHSILRKLLERGAKLPISHGVDCSHFIQHQLRCVYRTNDIELLNILVEYGFDPADVEQRGSCSMLGEAVKSLVDRASNDTSMLEWLLERGCNIDGFHDVFSVPLYVPLYRKQYDLSRWLIERGASLHTLSKTILFYMCDRWRGLDPFLVELAEGCNPDFSYTRNGMTALQMAARDNHVDFLKFAAEHNADFNQACESGVSPLMYAIDRGAKNAIKFLVNQGVELNALDANGDTPLDIALTRPNFKQVIEKMIKAGAKTGPELRGENSGQVSWHEEIRNVLKEGEPWADQAYKLIGVQDESKQENWLQLFRLCLECNSTKPSQQWLKQADVFVAGIGKERFRAILLEVFPMVKEKRTSDIGLQHEQYYGDCSHVIAESNTRLLRSLAWLASDFVDADMSRALRDLATGMYKKVYGIGMRNAKIGNAAVLALSLMPGTTGLKEIIILRSITKYNPALVNINRVFDRLAQERNMSPEELAALATPDYGLTGIGCYQEKIGEFEALLTLVKVGKAELVWKNDNGKVQKSVPAAVKKDHADSVKQLKALLKDVQTGSSAHSQRLEQLYLRRDSLPQDAWLDQYINHPLVGFLGRRLIWRLQFGDDVLDVMYRDGSYVDCHNRKVELPEQFNVLLWHPTMSSASEVLLWRNWLLEQQVTQPFKQAHREIYLLTDAERETATYSMRFANHILIQTQFHALATQRGWAQTRGGGWDGGQENSAYKRLSAYGITVEFGATGNEAYGYSNTGMYECVATDGVTFRNERMLPLEELDPLMFSEVMRDVDLFVGVSSIGNDPNWRDREGLYWQNSSFGELSAQAEVRKQVLEALVPKLKVAPRLKIDGRFLVVKGKVRTYRIHLGSSNILMEPNNSYLCIVEVKSKDDIMLPFEGDRTLSLILSKAMLLAQDDKIKDQTILNQIHC